MQRNDTWQELVARQYFKKEKFKKNLKIIGRYIVGITQNLNKIKMNLFHYSVQCMYIV